MTLPDDAPDHRPDDDLGLGPEDLWSFNEGTHARLFDHLGAHPTAAGTRFAVWAPAADRVAVTGDFNGWDDGAHPLSPCGSSGIWAGVVPGAAPGNRYKYAIANGGRRLEKADPFARRTEVPPATASVIDDSTHAWGDAEWMAGRAQRHALDAPVSVYEVHLGSWRRPDGRLPTYREIAEPLAAHVRAHGFTHVEFLPLMEHPFYGSWGYQVTGYFAPTARYGAPADLMYLVDHLHQQGIGVLFDWVPSHFPEDAFALGDFDGTHLYEHADPRQGFHPDWKSLIFNYGRNEVRSFLVSSAVFWLDRFHGDGLRVDGVASMLYLDYSRADGEWVPNRHGGRENLEAIDFLRQLNETVYRECPGIQTVAEESTAWPMVSRPTYLGGLGFGFKWDMGWMHDTLEYFGRDPIHRRWHQHDLTFRMVYAFTENFELPLSHDEVVHGKGSLLGRMPGDDWQRFANLRLLLGEMVGQPGKKLLFMGTELAEPREWDHDGELDWGLADQPAHAGVGRLVADANALYRSVPALHDRDCDPDGFEWLVADAAEDSVLAFLRKGAPDADGVVDQVAVVANHTPSPRTNYRIGVPCAGRWEEILNSDAEVYGGSGWGNYGGVEANPVPAHGRPFSVNVTLPPLAVVFLRLRGDG
ncbi:MAG: 1,4-alpha-glucan branching protein GlgB [Acidimicrobiales bacterium]|nr:1,4-alpha-glucan branching protein GlgB [Acidimicrobiales bacterium]MCB9374045.1 1,4-alpha-glucan branching protein GlgB [Microthrixaceae bacterium]